MPTTIERPVFYEGQVLGSSDLQRLLEYSRDESARHERYLHSWGIAEGLDVKKRGDDFVLEPGFAIDSSGAPIVVPESVVLDPQTLRSEALLSGDDAGYFPVFVVRAESEQTNGQLIGRCSTGAGRRRSESFAVQYRRIATAWDENQSAPAISDGPDDAPVSERVVLVGFLKWANEDGGKIVDFTPRNNGIAPRYAGVRADELLGRGGTVTLRSRAPSTPDAPMVVVNHHSNEKTFVLGLDDGVGRVNEVFTVDTKGNVHLKGSLTAAGTLKGQIRSGEVAIESGVASDGLTLPLPAGIDPERVKKGEVVIHTTVSARIDRSVDAALDPEYTPAVLECNVDEDRLVRCRIRWFKPPTSSSGPFAKVIDIAGAVNYTVVASVSTSAGGE